MFPLEHSQFLQFFSPALSDNLVNHILVFVRVAVLHRFYCTYFLMILYVSLHRNYYDYKIAMYFAWLGFYTQMLVVPSILGLIIFIYGVAYMQGRRRLSKSGTPIEHRWCSSCANGTRGGGGGERTRGVGTPSRKGGLGDLPKKIL